jgi:tetratricopeptide (TPR) repeat protein
MSTKEVFVGRARELGELNRLLDLALSGHGQVGFVAGEAGAGKTALLREFTRRAQEAHQDLVVASGECSDLAGQGDPYLPFREVLAELTGDVDAGVSEGAITPVNAQRLRGFLARSGQVLVDIAPDLINVVIPGSRVVAILGKAVASRVGWLEKLDGLAKTKRHDSALGAPSLGPDRVYEEYSAFLRHLSEIHPLVITLDDLHWVDAASAGLLFHLGRRIADRRILVLGTLRPDAIKAGRDGGRHPVDSILHEFSRYTGEGLIELAPATSAEGRAFVDALLDAEPNRIDEQFRDSLWRHTEGHPLFLAELLRALRERGDLFPDEQGVWVARKGIDWSTFPKRAEGMIGERIGRLEKPEREILDAASVEGETFTAEVLAHVLSQDPRSIVGRLAELDREQGLVSSAGIRRVRQQRLSSYSFRHHLVQQFLYQSIDASRRAYFHEDVAKALETLFADQDDEILGQLAHHYREAGASELALQYAIRAGDRASRLYANADAVTHYSSAISLMPMVEAESHQIIEVYRRRGRALELSGQPQNALSNYEEMEAVGQQRADNALVLAALTAQSVLLALPTVTHDPEKGRRLAGIALGLARDAGDKAAEARVLWSLLLISRYTGHPNEAVAYGEESIISARQLDSHEQLAFILHDLAGVYWMVGNAPKAAEAYAEACGLWRDLGNLPMLANTLGNDAQQSLAAGELGRALQLSDEALSIGRSTNNSSGVSFAQTLRGFVFMHRGEVSQGLQALREAVEAGEAGNNAYSMTGTRAEHGWALACTGAIEDGLGLARLAVDEAARHFQSARDWTAAILARIYLMSGDLPSAQAALPQSDFELTDEHLAEAAMFGGVAVGMAAGELALAQGRTDLARRSVDRLITHLQRLGARLYLADALRLQGKLLLAEGRVEAAHQALLDAREAAVASGSRFVAWSILDALADLEAAHGDAGKCDGLRREVSETVAFLAQNIDDPGQRAAFLVSPRVRDVLAKRPSSDGK